jgi:Tol biopolymer transport system component
MKRVAIAAVGLALVVLAACGGGQQEVRVSGREGEATPTEIRAPTPTQGLPATLAPTPQAHTAVTTEHGIYVNVIRPDGSGLRRLGPVGTGAIFEYSWSPDGKRLAFVNTTCRNSTVFVDEADSQSTRQLATVRGYADAAWEPDGQRLLIFSWEDDGSTHVLLVDAAGLAEPRELLDGSLARNWWGFAWSPDSTRIAYDDSGKANVLNVADGLTMTIAEDVGSGLSWAPDGKHLAYSTDTNDVVVIGADGSDRLVIASRGLSPQWMPDGQRLIFSRFAEDDGRIPKLPQPSNLSAFEMQRWAIPKSIAIVPAVGGPAEELTDGDPFDVSSDGDLVAVAVRDNEDGRSEIKVFDLAVGGSRVVSGQVDAWDELSFSPDGTQLLFRGENKPPPLVSSIYLVNVDGTGLRQLVQAGDGYVREPKWSADGRFIAFQVTTGGGCLE